MALHKHYTETQGRNFGFNMRKATSVQQDQPSPT